jgi:SAM-dependent methyltransferase
MYSQVIFPRLCDLLRGRPFVTRRRRELLVHAAGDILEIGFGTGLNLPYYPALVRKITTIDPNVGMHRRAQQRVRRSGIEVDQRVLRSEELPFGGGTFDCVVSTFTLCSIAAVGQALSEVYRVLRRGGRLLLMEHGLSPEPNIQKWQRRLNWLQMRLADGCHLDRNMRELVGSCPYSSLEIEEFYLRRCPGPTATSTEGSPRNDPGETPEQFLTAHRSPGQPALHLRGRACK